MEKDRGKCFELLAEIDIIREDIAVEILTWAFSGRLEWDKKEFSYCPGQLYDIEVLLSVRVFLEEYKKRSPGMILNRDIKMMIDWERFIEVLTRLGEHPDGNIKRHAKGLKNELPYN